MDEHDDLFTWKDGQRFFRELKAERNTVGIGVRRVDLVQVCDVADLLDEPDFAKQFLEQDRAPYGLELWPSSIALARYIEESSPGDGRTALDLGCGLGLVAILATMHGWKVTAADNEPTTLRFAQFNAELNHVSVDGFQSVDWRSPNLGRRFDRIFAADVLYQLVDFEPILACVKKLLAPDGLAVIADPKRSVADGFGQLAESHGFQVEEQHRAVDRTTGGSVGVRLFFLTAKPVG